MPEIKKVDSKSLSAKNFLATPWVKKRTEELLGKRAGTFIASVTSMISTDNKLAACEPISLFMACITAAALDLPINKSLGFAHIVPYLNKKTGITEAQFQMGWKGYVQLAKRSCQYKNIAVSEVYEGQLIDENPIDGNTYDWAAKKSDTIIGYVAKFKELNGFEKELYMSTVDVENHALKYSQSYKSPNKWTKENSPWTTNFDAMAKKTVVKLLLNSWATLTIEIQEAIAKDQAVIKDDNSLDYIDGELANVDATDDQTDVIIAAQKADKKAVDKVFNSDNNA